MMISEETKRESECKTSFVIYDLTENKDCDTEPRVERFVKSLRVGAVSGVLASCVNALDESDRRKLVAMFFLDQINHFCLQQERILVITRDALIRIKYDFNDERILKRTCIPFQKIKKVQFGELEINGPLLKHPIRNLNGGLGLRLFTHLEEPRAAQLWNPIQDNFPFSTFTTHNPTKLFGTPKDCHSITLFYQTLKSAMIAYDKIMCDLNLEKFCESSIEVQAGIGLWNFFYNGLELGRSLDTKMMWDEEKQRFCDAMMQVAQAVLPCTATELENEEWEAMDKELQNRKTKGNQTRGQEQEDGYIC